MATAQQEKVLYDYYKSGKMDESQLADYKGAISIEKNLNLPPGVTIDWEGGADIALAPIPSVPEGLAPPSQLELPAESELTPTDLRRQAAPEIGPETAYEYANDMMSHDEMREVNEIVNQGYRKMPEGMEVKEEEAPGILGLIAEKFQGKGKLTREIAEMPYYMDAPQFNTGGIKVASHAFSDTDEDMQKIKSDTPEAVFTQDAKKNWIVQYEPDGKKYAMAPPGMDRAQALDLAAEMLAFGKVLGPGAGRSMLSAMGIQTGVETLDTATGGTFDSEKILTTGVAEGVGLGLIRGAKGVGRAIKGDTAAIEAAKVAKSEFGSLAQTAGGAVSWTPKRWGAKDDLAQQMSTDKELLGALEELGISREMPTIFMSKSENTRKLVDSLAQLPKSPIGEEKAKAIVVASDNVRNIIESFGGSTKKTDFNQAFRGKLGNAIEEVESQNKDIWKAVDSAIVKSDEVAVDNLERHMKSTYKDVNRKGVISADVRKYYDMLKPKDKIVKEGGTFDVITGKTAKDQVVTENPTWQTLSMARQKLTDARMGKGDLQNLSRREINDLESALLDDQRAYIETLGGEELVNAFDGARKHYAQNVVPLRDLEKSIYAKEASSIFDKIGPSFGKLSKGDATQFTALIESIPKELRQEVAASSLTYSMAKNAHKGELNLKDYIDWFGKMKKHPDAYRALTKYLPEGSERILRNQYLISERLATKSKGLLSRSDLDGDLDNAYRKLATVMTIGGAYAAGGAVGGATGATGFGAVAMSSAMIRAFKGDKSLVNSVDKMMASKEFGDLILEKSEKSAKDLAKTTKFNIFWKNVKGDVKDNGAKERFIMSLIQTGKDKEEFKAGFTFEPLKIETNEE